MDVNTTSGFSLNNYDILSNPDCTVNIYPCFYSLEIADQFNFSEYTYIVDAIDTVTAKIELILCANEKNIPIYQLYGSVHADLRKIARKKITVRFRNAWK